LGRIVAATAWFTGTAALAAWAYFGSWWALSYLIGSLWMTLNFLALALLLSFILARRYGGRLFILLLMCAKIAVLYIALYWVFQLQRLDHGGLVAGITTLLVVILLKAVGQAAFPALPASGNTDDEAGG